MSFKSRVLKWFTPVIVFPLLVFFALGSVTDIILMNRGVQVEGVTVDANIDERRIVYEYPFGGEIYRHEYRFNGITAPSPLIGKKLSITLDPHHPHTHVRFDP